jgi:hypothetical protein
MPRRFGSGLKDPTGIEHGKFQGLGTLLYQEGTPPLGPIQGLLPVKKHHLAAVSTGLADPVESTHQGLVEGGLFYDATLRLQLALGPSGPQGRLPTEKGQKIGADRWGVGCKPGGRTLFCIRRLEPKERIIKYRPGLGCGADREHGTIEVRGHDSQDHCGGIEVGEASLGRHHHLVHAVPSDSEVEDTSVGEGFL